MNKILMIACFVIAIYCLFEIHNANEEYSYVRFVPRVKEVTIANTNSNVLSSNLESGMLTNETLKQMQDFSTLDKTQTDVYAKGEDGYKASQDLLKGSLELQSTQEDSRLQVAAAISGYIPPNGIENSGLWNQRNTLDNLFQPGLNGSDGKPSCACK